MLISFVRVDGVAMNALFASEAKRFQRPASICF